MNMTWNALQPWVKRIAGHKAFRIGAAALVVYAVLGFFLLPYALEHYVPKYAKETLKRQASIGAVRINPFLFKIEIDDFRLQEADGRPIAAFRRVSVDFETSSLFRWAWTFADIRVEGLDLLIDTAPNRRLNLVALADSFSSGEAPQPADDSGPPRLLLTHIALVDGVVTYSDRTSATPASVALRPVDLEFNNVSTLPERNGPYTLSAEFPEGGKARVQGALTLHPLTATGKLAIQGFQAATLWNFLRDEVRLAEPKGAIDLQLAYRFGYAGGKPQLGVQGVQLHAAGLDVREPKARQPLLAVETLDIKDGQFDLDSRALTVPQLALRNGRVGAALTKDGTLNWQTLVITQGKPAAPPPPATAQTAPWRIQLSAVQVDAVAVHVDDRSRATPLALDVGKFGASLNADINVGSPATTVTANAIALDLSKIALTPIETSGIDTTKPLATLAQFKLDGGKVDTARCEVGINKVSLREGSTRIERDAQGATRLFAALNGAGDDAPDKTKANTTASADQPTWRVKLDTLQLNAFRVGLADQSLKPALAYDLEDITATLKNLSNATQTPVDFDARLRVAQGGTLNAYGRFTPDGSTAKATLKIERVALKPLQSLLARHAALDLKAGDASAMAELEYAPGKTGSVLRAGGTASVADLLIDEAVGGDRFVAWKALTADGIAFASDPDPDTGKLTIKEMHLVEPGAKVMIFEDRSVNLGRVFEKKTAAASGTSTQAPSQISSKHDASTRPFPVTVARIRVEKGVVDYSDQSLVLPFSAQIRDFHGAVTGISSDPESRAKIAFDGRVEQYGQAKVRGALRPFAPKQYTDIRTEFRNIDMPPFSPYSATFAGRKIATGKLSLDLEYKIDAGALAGDNKILLDKFTLGEPIDSPDALDLPLDLAVALLTDSRGRIDIAVPVSGDMNSPKFSLGGVIGQAVTRMLTKIVTAPFSALGNLLGGGGKQANAIAFEPGSDQLSPPQQEKLVNLGKALRERPQLKVIVGGRYAPEQDGAALRSDRVRRALAVELDVKLAPDEDPGPVAFDQAQTQRALEKLLEARAGDKAVDAFQAQFETSAGRAVERVNPVLALIGQESPDHAFYEALFEHVVEIHPLGEADLKTLARRRADVVVQSLTADAGVDPQRVEAGAIETIKSTRDTMVETKLTLDVLQPAAK
ncbi:MAG: DUF748 domain-containing protein [Gammaproteobacteria bacterium]|nr:DUF748 domain-containing protein [Gammaproteobacteria bacterium]